METYVIYSEETGAIRNLMVCLPSDIAIQIGEGEEAMPVPKDTVTLGKRVQDGELVDIEGWEPTPPIHFQFTL